MLFFLGFALLSCTPARTAHGEPANTSAEQYLDWLSDAIRIQEKQINTFARTADEAADHFVKNKRWSVGLLGGGGFEAEGNGRAGGLIRIQKGHQVTGDRWRGILLVGLLNHRLDRQFEIIREKREQGCFVVAFGTRNQRRAARNAEVEVDGFINTGARKQNGLVPVSNGEETDRLLPTQPVANMVALWIWTGEFVAAVTRRNRMTPMYLAYTIPGGRRWRKEIGMQKFHGKEIKMDPVQSGVLGARFIRALREDLKSVRDTELDDVRAVAKIANETRSNGGTLYAFLHGHALQNCVNGPHDPGLFRKANRGWFDLRWNVEPDEGDLLFCLGFDRLFDGGRFGTLAQDMRRNGVKLAWSVSVNDPQNDYSRPDDEPLIDQKWPYGDASVPLPGYPFKILPTSGVISQSIFWMVQAEMLKR